MKYTIDVKVETEAKLVDAFAGMYNYQEVLKDLLGGETRNPESKEDFAKRKIGEYIREIINAYEVSQAVETAQNTATKISETDIKIT